MSFEIRCSRCGKTSANPLDFKCLSCGGPLDVEIHENFERQRIGRKNSIWRYLSFFPFVNKEDIVTLGEGNTPLVELSANLYVKLDSLNPTGSFKDRGSTVLISAIHRLVKRVNGYISEDSSGNAGASIAAYAARAELKAKIFVPDTVSGPKLNQIRFYGADVTKIAGERTAVTEEAQRPEKGKIYAGHVLHPLFRDGIRSLAYEIAEQLQWNTSVTVYVPVSAGTLLLGLLAGFRHMFESGVIQSLPRVVACQTEQVSPLYHRFMNLDYKPPPRVTSIADALVSIKPPLLDLMVNRLREADGEVVVTSESEVHNAFVRLARDGFFVEPSSAVAYAAYEKKAKTERTSVNEKVVVVLTGSGLKTAPQLP